MGASSLMAFRVLAPPLLVLVVVCSFPVHTAAHTHCHHTNCTFGWTVVTATSGNHFCPLEMFGLSVATSWIGWTPAESTRPPPPRLLIYDLGLGEKNLEHLRKHLVKAWQVFCPYLEIEVRRFEYEKYPPYFNVSIARGEYAWKPAIIYEIAVETKAMLQRMQKVIFQVNGKERPPLAASQGYGSILWVDAGVMLSPPAANFSKLFTRLASQGFMASSSTGHGRDWNHPGLYKYYNLSEDKIQKVNESANCNAAAVFFNIKEHPRLFDEVIEPWYECAMVKECIAPTGSSRGNHRQDQSVLGVLTVLHASYSCGNVNFGDYGLHYHIEGGCFCNQC